MGVGWGGALRAPHGWGATLTSPIYPLVSLCPLTSTWVDQSSIVAEGPLHARWALLGGVCLSGLFHWAAWAPLRLSQDQKPKKIQPGGVTRPKKMVGSGFPAFVNHSHQPECLGWSQTPVSVPWLQVFYWPRLMKEPLGTWRAWLLSTFVVKLSTQYNFDLKSPLLWLSLLPPLFPTGQWLFVLSSLPVSILLTEVSTENIL